MSVLPEPSEWDFDKLGHRGKAFKTANEVSKSSYLIIEIDGAVPQFQRESQCDFVYYVLSGSGEFVIDDVRSACEDGQLVVVPAGRKFAYRGRMRMLLICTPPWNDAQEDVLEGVLWA